MYIYTLYIYIYIHRFNIYINSKYNKHSLINLKCNLEEKYYLIVMKMSAIIKISLSNMT